mgnify:FL=1
MSRYDHTRLDDLLSSRLRLAIMAVLATLERAGFTYLREHVKTTDGNLATHLRKLEEAGYVRVAKRFEARKPVTDYALTARGRRALGEHLDQIEQLLGPTRR